MRLDSFDSFDKQHPRIDIDRPSGKVSIAIQSFQQQRPAKKSRQISRLNGINGQKSHITRHDLKNTKQYQTI